MVEPSTVGDAILSCVHSAMPVRSVSTSSRGECRMSQTQVLACDCTVTPPPWDIVEASFEQLRERRSELGYALIFAGDLVAKSGTRWLQSHGFSTREEGLSTLTLKGSFTTWHALFLEYDACVASRPGVHRG